MNLEQCIEYIHSKFRKGSIPVQSPVIFHFDNGMLNQFLFITAQFEQIKKFLFSLYEFHRAEASGNIDAVCVILNNMTNGMNTTVHRSVWAKVHNFGDFLLFCRCQKCFNQFRNAVVNFAKGGSAAQATREHNDSNIICLGERIVGPGLAMRIVDTWLEASFQGGRHQVRVDMISELEN